MLIAFRFVGFSLACLLLMVVGCSPSKVKITGKLLKGGKPLIVSKETYVTLQFLPESVSSESSSNSYSATFDQQTGTFRLELPPGKYKTNFIMALPAKDGQMSKPTPPVKSDKVYDLSKDQDITVEIP